MIRPVQGANAEMGSSKRPYGSHVMAALAPDPARCNNGLKLLEQFERLAQMLEGRDAGLLLLRSPQLRRGNP